MHTSSVGNNKVNASFSYFSFSSLFKKASSFFTFSQTVPTTSLLPSLTIEEATPVTSLSNPLFIDEKYIEQFIEAKDENEDFEKIKKPTLPFKGRLHTGFTILEKNEETCHRVLKLKKEKNNSIYYFKQNKNHQTQAHNYTYELEAAIADCYRLIAPDHVPASVKAHYNEKGEYIGVSAKEIVGFNPIKNRPLTMEDLVLPENIDITDWINIDNAAKEKKLNLDELPETQEIIIINNQIITAKHLRNFRIIKGLAICFVISLFFAEDDLHKGNFCVESAIKIADEKNTNQEVVKRVDFDMSGWPLMRHFKAQSNLGDTFTRSRWGNDAETRFLITAYDIDHLPNIRDAKPFYFPAIPTHYYETVRSTLASFNIPISKNAFTVEENNIFQSLEKNPIFIYFKFATYLKISLTNTKMYYNKAKLHIRKTITANEHQNLIDVLSYLIGDRIQKTRDVLTQMSSFSNFISSYGDIAFKGITADFKKQNDYYDEKIKKQLDNEKIYQKQKINLVELNEVYHKIKTNTLKLNEDQNKLNI